MAEQKGSVPVKQMGVAGIALVALVLLGVPYFREIYGRGRGDRLLDGSSRNQVRAAAIANIVTALRDTTGLQLRDTLVSWTGFLCGEARTRRGIQGDTGWVPFIAGAGANEAPNFRTMFFDSIPDTAFPKLAKKTCVREPPDSLRPWP